MLSGYIGDKKPVTVTYLGSQLIANDAGFSSVSFSAFNGGSNGIGAANSTRQIVVAIYTIGTATNSYPTSMTIGGVAASRVTSAFSAANNVGVTIWKASVPTGTTATIVAPWSAANGVRAFAMVYSVLDASTTVYNTATPDTTLSGEVLSTTVNTIGGGAVIAVAMGRASSGSPSFTWSGVTENADASVTGAYAVYGATAGHSTNNTNNTVTITATQTGAASTAGLAGLAACSFQPL